jgi:hypothetical protein
MAYRRIADALHEIGLLLIAFAPLDYALDPRPFSATWVSMISFLVLGIAFVGLSIVGDWRFLK